MNSEDRTENNEVRKEDNGVSMLNGSSPAHSPFFYVLWLTTNIPEDLFIPRPS